MKTDVMFDIETLSLNSFAAILSVGAVQFDLYGDKLTLNETNHIYETVCVDSCLLIGLEIDKETQDWWDIQDEDAKQAAFDPIGRLPISEVMDKLTLFCQNAERIWSYGSLDIIACENACKRLAKPLPWHYKKVRDARTALAVNVNTSKPHGLRPHHALDDALGQAVRVQKLAKKLDVLGIRYL